MTDPIFDSFLARQLQKGTELANRSDVLDLLPVSNPSGPVTHFVARFRCRGVVRLEDKRIEPVDGQFHVGIAFHADHLRRINPMGLMTWLDPPNIYHPNIVFPTVCAGRIQPGVELVDLLYQVFEIITYNNWASHDALNAEAAEWARNNQHLFPLERRPLKRIAEKAKRESKGGGGAAS